MSAVDALGLWKQVNQTETYCFIFIHVSYTDNSNFMWLNDAVSTAELFFLWNFCCESSFDYFCFPFICLFVCLMNNLVSSSIRKICHVNIKVQTKYGTQIGLQKQIMPLYIHLKIFLQSTYNGFIHTAVANFAWCCLILGLYRTACINTKRFTGIICSIKASRWRKTRDFCTYTVC